MTLVLFLFSRASSVMGLQIVACVFIFRAVEQGVDAYGLSQLGLAATMASMVFAFPIGAIVDRMKKKTAILLSHFILCLLVLSVSVFDPYSISALIIATGFLALSRNFRSISQFTVFGELLNRSASKDRWINFSTLSWQIAAFISPLIAGILGSGRSTLVVAAILIGFSFLSQFRIVRVLTLSRIESPQPLRNFLAFLQGSFKLRSSLILDFFIVLFAGAASLLPYLHANRGTPIDIGLLRSALPAGVIFGTLVRLNKTSINGWAEKLFYATLGYGVCHLLLAESSSIELSYALLFGAGIFDALSLAVRECILQIETPPEYKGRVYALNNFLVNASDELSEWESGVSAHWFGIRPAIRISGALAITGALWFGWRTAGKNAKAIVN